MLLTPRDVHRSLSTPSPTVETRLIRGSVDTGPSDMNLSTPGFARQQPVRRATPGPAVPRRQSAKSCRPLFTARPCRETREETRLSNGCRETALHPATAMAARFLTPYGNQPRCRELSRFVACYSRIQLPLPCSPSARRLTAKR